MSNLVASLALGFSPLVLRSSADEWQAGVSNAESTDPFVRAMTDRAHVQLNSNETKT